MNAQSAYLSDLGPEVQPCNRARSLQGGVCVCVCGTGQNVAMTQKDTEGEFTAHLLPFIAHQHYLCGFA